MPSVKTRITNLLIATLQLLITAVWIPTFWTLAELPWTLNEKKEASALLRYVDDDLGTVSYKFSNNCNKNKEKNWLLEDESAQRPSGKYSDLFDCERNLTTSTGSSFIPLVVFTLLILGAQYLLTGKVTLRLTRKAEESS
jgi:hypothetical protein